MLRLLPILSLLILADLCSQVWSEEAIAKEVQSKAEDGSHAQEAAKPLTPWDKAEWPWEKDREYLKKREEALARLIAVHVVPFADGHPAAAYDQPDAPKTFAKLRINSFVTHIRDIDQFGSDPGEDTNHATDQVILENMKWFPEIKRFCLWSSDVTDEGLKIVLKMPYLEIVEVQNFYPPSRPCRITDEGIKTLAQCQNLKELSFLAVKMSDEGVKHLSELPDLEKLNIEATFVTPECLRYLVRMPRLKSVRLGGNRGVMGHLSYTDIPDYDHLCRPMPRAAAKEMASAQGVPKTVIIDNTLAIDPSVFEALCITPTVAAIRLSSDTHWNHVSYLRALSGQKHLKRVECYETRNPTPEVIKTLESVDNDALQLGVVLDRVRYTQLPLHEWLDWAKKEVGTKRANEGSND